jgi:hypothetical protein
MKTTTREKILKIMRQERNFTPPAAPRRHYKQ